MSGILLVLETCNKNMHPASIGLEDEFLYIAMDDYDAYHGWKFTRTAEHQLLKLLLERNPDQVGDPE